MQLEVINRIGNRLQLRGLAAVIIIAAIVVIAIPIPPSSSATTPITTRYSDYNDTDFGNGTHSILYGLPPRLPDGAGHYNQDYYFYNNTNVYTIATGFGTYNYIVSSCGLKFYEPTQSTSGKIPIVNSFTYTVRHSDNSNFSPNTIEQGLVSTCVNTTVIDTGKHLQINGTKQNANVTFTISYTFDAGKPVDLAYYVTPKINAKYWRMTEAQADGPNIIETFNATINTSDNSAFPNNYTKVILSGSLKNNATNSTGFTYIDNQNRIMRYNFGTSINVLSRMGISYNYTNQKTQLFSDFQTSSILATNQTFTIDPSFGMLDPSSALAGSTSGLAQATCPSTSAGNMGTSSYEILYTASTGAGCRFPFAQWDIGSLKDVTVTNVVLKFDVVGTTNPRNCDYVPLSHDLTIKKDALDYITDLLSNSASVSNDATCSTTGTGKEVSLGVSTLQTAINKNQPWYNIGFRYNGNTRDGSNHETDLDNVQLEVSYKPQNLPSQPTIPNLSPNENSFTLNWNLANDNGGTAVTKYGITKTTTNYFLGEALPDNNKSDNMTFPNALNFGHSETMLLHLDGGNFTFATDKSGNDRSVIAGDAFFEEQYNKTSNWSTTGSNIDVNPVTSIGTVKFNAVADGADNRVHQVLSSPLSDTLWQLQFEWQPTAQATADHYAIILANNTNNPDTTAQQNNIAINAINNAGTLSLKICSAYNTATKTCTAGQINTPVGTTTYYVAMNRTSANNVSLHVYSDQLRTFDVTGSPISLTVDSNIKGLNTIMHSARSSKAGGNTLTATIDNLVISSKSKSVMWNMKQLGCPINYCDRFDGTQSYLNVTTNIATAKDLGLKDYNDFTLGLFLSNQTSDNLGRILSLPKTAALEDRFVINSTHMSIFTDSSIPIVQNAITNLPTTYWTDDLFYNAGWKFSGTSFNGIYPTINTNLGVINFTNVEGAVSQSYIQHQLPLTLNATNWQLNFIYKQKAISGGAVGLGYFLALSDTSIPLGNNYISLAYSFTGTNIEITGSSGTPSASLPISLNVQYYCTLTRNGNTVTLHVYSDSQRTKDIANSPITATTTSGNTGHKFISSNSIFAANVMDANYLIGQFALVNNAYSPMPTPSHWHSIVFTRNGDNWRTFYDGIQQGGNVTQHQSLGSSNFVILGANSTGNGKFATGYVDEIFMLNRTITSNEVKNFQNRIVGGLTWQGYTWLANTNGYSFTDGNITNNNYIFDGQTVCYRINAMNANYNGSYTNAICDHTWTLPKEPTGLSATRVSSSQVNMTWTSPSYTGGTGSSLLGYYVQRNNATGYLEQPFIPNTLSHFKFDSDKLLDYGSLKNNLTLSSGHTTIASGEINKGISLDGSTYFTIPNQNNYNFERTNPISFSGWFQTSSGTNQMILAKGGTAGLDQDGYQVYLDSSGHLTFVEANPAGTQKIKVHDNSFNYANGNFQNFVIVYNGSSLANGIKIFHNGTLQTNTVDANNLASSIQNNKEVTIGAVNGGSTKFIGTLDDVRIFNRAITTIQVTNIANYRFQTTTSFSDNSVGPNNINLYKVSAVNIIGIGPLSNSSTAFGLPSPPQNLACHPISTSQITCTYNPPVDNGGTPITGYKYQVNGTGTTTIANVTSFTKSGLAPLHTEQFRALATNSQGDGIWSANVTASTFESTQATVGLTKHIVGSIADVISIINVTAGVPDPSVIQIQFKNFTTTVATVSISPPITIAKGTSHSISKIFNASMTSLSNFTAIVTITNATGTITSTSNFTLASPKFQFPTPSTPIDAGGKFLWWNATRDTTGTSLNIKVLRNPTPFGVEILVQTQNHPKGIWYNFTKNSYIDMNSIVDPNQIAYITGFNDTEIFNGTSSGLNTFNINGTFTLIQGQFGDFFGAPIITAIILLFAGIWTGKNANTGLIVIATALSIFSAVGLIIFSSLEWGLVIICVTLGVLLGRKYS